MDSRSSARHEQQVALLHRWRPCQTRYAHLASLALCVLKPLRWCISKCYCAGPPQPNQGRGYSSYAISQDLAASDASINEVQGSAFWRQSQDQSNQVSLHVHTQSALHLCITLYATFTCGESPLQQWHKPDNVHWWRQGPGTLSASCSFETITLSVVILV